MKKILITGTTGMLGASLIRLFKSTEKYEVFGLGRTKSSLLPDGNQTIMDLSSTHSSIQRLNFVPDYIIHTAALTDLGLCERDPKLANLVHVDGSKAIANLGEKRTKFFYISTDSVFDGKRGCYAEDDAPHPLNEYASTKLRGESAVKESAKGEVIILRTNIYGYHIPMRASLAEWAYLQWKAGNTINGFSDTIFNAVFTSQLGAIIELMIDKNVFLPLLNIGSNAAISKYDFLNKFREKLGVGSDLLKSSISTNYPSPVQRPKNTSLNTSLLSTFCSVPGFDEGIQGWINESHESKLTPDKQP